MESEGHDINYHEEGMKSSLSALSVGAVRDLMYDLHIKKHIWRAPKLLHDATVPEPSIQFQHRLKVHREETWYELFYDLVFVAAALQIGHIVQSDISAEGLFKSGVLFAVMRATWDQLTFYQNRFDTKDMLHYVFYLLQAMCAFGMAEHLTVNEETEKWDDERNLAPFAVAVAIARVSNATMYMQIMSLSTAYRRHFMGVSFSQILSSLLYILPAVVTFCKEHYVWFWLAALLCERTFVMMYIYLVCPNEKDSFRAPWHMYHLINREVRYALSSLLVHMHITAIHIVGDVHFINSGGGDHSTCPTPRRDKYKGLCQGPYRLCCGLQCWRHLLSAAVGGERGHHGLLQAIAVICVDIAASTVVSVNSLLRGWH